MRILTSALYDALEKIFILAKFFSNKNKLISKKFKVNFLFKKMQGSRDIQNATRQLVPKEHARNFISFATKNYYIRQENMSPFIWKLDDSNAWYNLL